MSKYWEVASWTPCTDWETVGKIAAELQWVWQLLCTNLHNNNKNSCLINRAFPEIFFRQIRTQQVQNNMPNLNSPSSNDSIFWVVGSLIRSAIHSEHKPDSVCVFQLKQTHNKARRFRVHTVLFPDQSLLRFSHPPSKV